MSKSKSSESKTVLLSAVTAVLSAPWDTGSLKANNAFTTTLALRSAGYLYRAGYLSETQISSLKRSRENPKPSVDGETDEPIKEFRLQHDQTLRSIAIAMAKGVPESLSVGGYPPSPTVAYWLLDAIWALKANIDDQTARQLFEWGGREFFRQVSLVSANDHTRMDPIALAMAACVCRLLRKLARLRPNLRARLAEAINFPTDVQLRSAVNEFLKKQNGAGVWEKYFPIFHYPGAGPNHCWHFEVLEAVLNEFPECLQRRSTLRRVEKSLTWLQDNRLAWQSAETPYFGWNSGGDFKALQTGQPESWPTGVAHMCLWRLRHALSIQIQELVLRSYGERVKFFRSPDKKDWRRYLDCAMPVECGLVSPRNTVKGVVRVEMMTPAKKSVKSHLRTAVSSYGHGVGPAIRLNGRIAALLFGPPGTSKTSFAEAVAKRLGWPFLELSPSDFLKGGLSGIYDRVNDVFADLMDLFGVVILFDEMDALVQSREDKTNEGDGKGKAEILPQLDVTQKFLTTSMLPKLLQLRAQRRTIFFMATNHQRDFDSAIKRKGRFDLLIRMGPPSYEEKITGLDHWLRDEPDDQKEQIRELVSEWTESTPIRNAFELFTYGEVDAFFDFVRQKDEVNERLLAGLKKLDKVEFEKAVDYWMKERITLRKGTLSEYNGDDAKVYPIQ